MPPEEYNPSLEKQAESAVEKMRRIERELRAPLGSLGTEAGTKAAPGVGRAYVGTAGGNVGPLSGAAVLAANPRSGAPAAAVGRGALQAGPVELNYQRVQPAMQGARGENVVGVGGRPFDPDTYFGVQASQGPAGRGYGVNVGRGGLNAYGNVNPQRKDASAGLEYRFNFADGGPVMPSFDPMGGFTGMESVEQAGRAPGAYERIADRVAGAGATVGEPLRQAAEGLSDIPGTVGRYFSEVSAGPDPSQRLGEDIRKFGSMFVEEATKGPAEFAKTVGGFLPVIGEGISAYDAVDLYEQLKKAEAEGDEKKATSLRQLYGMAVAGAAPGVGIAARIGRKMKGAKGAEEVAEGAARAADEAAVGAAETTERMGGSPEQAAEAADKAAKMSEANSAADEINAATRSADEAAETADAVEEAAREHAMNVERGARKTISQSSVKMTDIERGVVNGFKSPGEQAKVATAIRATKSRYPASDGWAPIEAIGASFDDKGNAVIKWKEQTYGYNKGDVKRDVVVLDDAGNPVKQPKLDKEGNPVLDADGNPVYTKKNVTREETFTNQGLRRGTPEYDTAIDKAVKNALKDIRDVVKRATDGDEAAKVILRQLGWYREFMAKGFNERGGSYPAFSDLLGATSPNTAVDQNYRYSVGAQQRFARGDFDPQVQFAKDYAQSGESLNKFPEDQLIRRNDAIDKDTLEFKQYGMNSRNAQMAMADLWRELEAGQAPKARNFSGNLGGATDKATIDVWAARFVNRMLGRKRLPPPVESGVKGKLGADMNATGEFGFGQDVFQRLSDELNKSNELQPWLQQLGYNSITPMDLQALSWFIEKELWTKKNWTSKAGEGGSFEDEMRKYPSNRWQAGMSITQTDAPTNDAMAVTRRIIENSVRTDDDVMVYRVHPTYGRYGGTDERSFDIELTAKPNWDPSKWMASIIDEAKGNNQKDVFFAKRLDAAEAKSNPNARPGVEIYFESRKAMEEILPILDEFTKRGNDGFTFTTDLRLRERLSGGSDSPDYVGVRLQYVPEIRMRFDDDFRNSVLSNRQVLLDDMDEAANNMQAALDALDRAGARIVDARMHHYDTLVVGKESYDQFLRGLSDPSNAAGAYAETVGAVDPRKRFGQSIFTHVEGRDRALRKGAQGRAPDAGGAVDQPNPEVGFAKGGAASKARKIEAALENFRDVAKEHNVYKPQLAYLIRQADPRMPREQAALYARNMLSEDLSSLTQRLINNPKAIPILKGLEAQIKKGTSDRLVGELRRALRDHAIKSR
ncbi:MAG: hypothetical protein ACO26U_05165 [Burkholderiaceae bacterium]